MKSSREQFEASWLRRGGEESDLVRYPESHHEAGSGNVGGQYVVDDVQGHWKTWQASRAEIEIELPDKVMVEDDFDNGHNCAIDYCADAIHAAGLTVKGDA